MIPIRFWTPKSTNPEKYGVNISLFYVVTRKQQVSELHRWKFARRCRMRISETYILLVLYTFLSWNLGGFKIRQPLAPVHTYDSDLFRPIFISTYLNARPWKMKKEEMKINRHTAAIYVSIPGSMPIKYLYFQADTFSEIIFRWFGFLRSISLEC